jgi:hypothetical protein
MRRTPTSQTTIADSDIKIAKNGNLSPSFSHDNGEFGFGDRTANGEKLARVSDDRICVFGERPQARSSSSSRNTAIHAPDRNDHAAHADKPARLSDEGICILGPRAQANSFPSSRSSALHAADRRHQLDKMLDPERYPSRKHSIRDLRDQIDLRSPKSPPAGIMAKHLKERLNEIKALEPSSSEAVSLQQGRGNSFRVSRTNKSLALGHSIDQMSHKVGEVDLSPNELVLDPDYLLDLTDEEPNEDGASPTHLDHAIAKSLLFERRLTPFLQAVEEELDVEEDELPCKDRICDNTDVHTASSCHNSDLACNKQLSPNPSWNKPQPSVQHQAKQCAKPITQERNHARQGNVTPDIAVASSPLHSTVHIDNASSADPTLQSDVKSPKSCMNGASGPQLRTSK